MAGGWKTTRTASIIGQTNTMGGVKKQGLPSTVGVDASVSNVYRQRVGCPCPFILSTTKSCSYIGSTQKGRC